MQMWLTVTFNGEIGSKLILKCVLRSCNLFREGNRTPEGWRSFLMNHDGSLDVGNHGAIASSVVARW